MGHLFLDAYHATGDEYYYQAAEQVAGALIWAQHPSGGWNYIADFAGDRSLREWYDTVGRNAWRLEEFQHYWGNATFDDAGHGGVGEVPPAALRREAGSEVQAAARQGDPVRRRQPVSDRRLAAAVSAAVRILASRETGLHLVSDLQRRCRGGEHRFPGDVLSGARRRRGCSIRSFAA